MTLILPPSDVATEMALLGSCLIPGSASKWFSENVTPKAFYSEKNKTIAESIHALVESGSEIDIVTVVSDLKKSGKMVIVGGPDYIQSCLDAVATAAHVEDYGRIVLRCHIERQIIAASQNLQSAISRADTDDRTKAIDLISKLGRDRDNLETSDAVSMRDAMLSIMAEIDSGKAAPLILTGIPGVDNITGGHERGDLVTLGARTGVGKTATLLTIGVNMAVSGERVAYFGGEMPGEQIAKRSLSARSGVEGWRIRQRKFQPGQVKKLTEAASDLSELTLYFCNTKSPTIRDISAFSNSVKATVIIVDYLTRCIMPKAESYRVGVNHFMRELKNIANDSHRIVLLGSQISRQIDKDKNRPPVLADLKESGAIEEESDVVLLLHVEGQQDAPEGSTVGVQFAIAKNRHGKRGVAEIPFNRATMLVGDLDSQKTQGGPIPAQTEAFQHDHAKAAAGEYANDQDVPF